MSQFVLRAAALLGFCLAGCQSIPTVEGNGKASRRTIELERPVTAVCLADSLTADLLQLSSGGVQEAALLGDENLLDELQLSQHEGTLSIRVQPGVSLRTRLGLKLIASLPFDSVSLARSSYAHLRLSGRFLKLSLYDSSSANAVGRLASLELSAKNSSHFDFNQCPVREAFISMENTCRGIAEVRSRIRELDLFNASRLELIGAPTIDQQVVADASEVIQRG